MKTCKAMPPIQNNLWGEHITNAMQSSHVIHLAPKYVGWEHYNIIFITATWSMKQNFSKGFKKKAVEKVKQNCETVSQRTFTQNLSEINVTNTVQFRNHKNYKRNLFIILYKKKDHVFSLCINLAGFVYCAHEFQNQKIYIMP